MKLRPARSRWLLLKPSSSPTIPARQGACIVRRCGKSKIAKLAQQFSRLSSRVPQRLHGIDRIGEAMPTGGARHELADPFRSLGTESPRIEAALLPDHAGKELDWKGVLRRRLF